MDSRNLEIVRCAYKAVGRGDMETGHRAVRFCDPRAEADVSFGSGVCPLSTHAPHSPERLIPGYSPSAGGGESSPNKPAVMSGPRGTGAISNMLTSHTDIMGLRCQAPPSVFAGVSFPMPPLEGL